jgi:hypothetical protein
MSNLKEEWASLMKLRGLGQAEQGKKEEIKARIFNNFYSVRQENIEKKPFEPDIAVKADYEQLRQGFLHSISTDSRAKTPDIPKKFEFGLKHINLPTSSNKLNRPDLKSEEIWTMKDSPFNKNFEEPLLDCFEQVSIADNQGGVSKTGKFSRFLNIFSDFSPVTRYLCSLPEEEEAKYTKVTSSHESHIFSLFHLVHQELTYEDLSEISWKKAADFTKGLIFRTQVSSILNPPALVKDLSISENEKNSVSQCLSEPPIFLDNSIRKNAVFKTSNSTVPFVQPSTELENLEKELMDMMDQIKSNYKSVSTEQKIKMLLKKTEERLKSKPELARNTQVSAVFQFLQEYLKSQEKKQPPATKRLTQKKSIQKKSVTPIRGSKLSKDESVSSMGSNRSSKWIGGSKHQADFEDDDWVNMNKEKKKPETRHEMLYKLSMKK